MLLFLLIIPTYLYNFTAFVLVSNLFKYFLIGYFLLDLIKGYKKCSLVFWLIVASYIAQGISTAMMQPDLLFNYINQTIRGIAFYYFIDKHCHKKRATSSLGVLAAYLELMVWINLVTIVIFPNGMYTSGVYTRNFWMGYDNTHIRWQIPAVAISCIYSLCKFGKITKGNVTLIVVVVLSTILVGSGTSTIAIMLFVVGLTYILLCKNKEIERGINFFTPFMALIVGIVGSILVIGATIASLRFELLNRVISLFGKDLTLTGRSYIWISALNSIQSNLIWGLGYETSDITSMRLVGRLGYGSSPHNICLEALYNGGIVYAILIVLIYLAINSNLKKVSRVPAASVCGLWLFVVSIMGLAEPQFGSYLRIAWIVCYNLPYICKENGTEMVDVSRIKLLRRNK